MASFGRKILQGEENKGVEFAEEGTETRNTKLEIGTR
jgi:hypothetical protein